MDMSDCAVAKVDWCYISDSSCLENGSRVGKPQGGALAYPSSLYWYHDNDMEWKWTTSVRRLDDQSMQR